MSGEHPVMKREKKTVEVMINIYCKAHHEGANELCAECRKLLEYAEKRLDKCPFQENKTPCGICTIHCYKESMRDRIKVVMRYAGPRMLPKHPVLVFHHVLKRLRKNKTMSK